MFKKIRKLIYKKRGYCIIHSYGQSKTRNYFQEWTFSWKVCDICNKVKKGRVELKDEIFHKNSDYGNYTNLDGNMGF